MEKFSILEMINYFLISENSKPKIVIRIKDFFKFNLNFEINGKIYNFGNVQLFFDIGEF